MSHSTRSVLVLGAMLLTQGCSTTKQAHLARLEKQLQEIVERDATRQKRLDDLDNRVFLLEDKVDTGQVAQLRSEQRPVLPVIRLTQEGSQLERSDRNSVTESTSAERDTTRAHGDHPSHHDTPSATGESIVAVESITYEGEALSTKNRERPSLKIVGNAPGSSQSSKNAASTSQPITLSNDPQDSLPVTPLPSRVENKPSTTPTPATTKSSHAVVKTVDATSVMSLYNQAIEHLRNRNYRDAISGFETIVARFPQHPYADNALYWLGECYYDQSDFKQALTVFRRVVESYSTGNKAPDALLKVGFSYGKLNQHDHARMVLKQVVEIYPKSTVAELATRALTNMP